MKDLARCKNNEEGSRKKKKNKKEVIFRKGSSNLKRPNRQGGFYVLGFFVYKLGISGSATQVQVGSIAQESRNAAIS